VLRVILKLVAADPLLQKPALFAIYAYVPVANCPDTCILVDDLFKMISPKPSVLELSVSLAKAAAVPVVTAEDVLVDELTHQE